jgi:hypothetical protein
MLILERPFAADASPTLVPLAETMMRRARAGLALELPAQSPCGYEHEPSTPGAWATGDVLLHLTFASWNWLVLWLRTLDTIRPAA